MDIALPSFPSFSFHISAPAPTSSVVPPPVVKTMGLWNEMTKLYAAASLITVGVHLTASYCFKKIEIDNRIKIMTLNVLDIMTFFVASAIVGVPTPIPLWPAVIIPTSIFGLGVVLYSPSKSFRAAQN